MNNRTNSCSRIRVSVPYRGATFLNHVHRTNGKKNSVSVPYRGATFLNNSLMRLPAGGRKFPSPIGELHFSIRISNIIQNPSEECFRPLSGSYISQYASVNLPVISVGCSFRPLSGSYISQYHPRNPMFCLGQIGGLRGKSNFIEMQPFWKVKNSHKSSI